MWGTSRDEWPWRLSQNSWTPAATWGCLVLGQDLPRHSPESPDPPGDWTCLRTGWGSHGHTQHLPRQERSPVATHWQNRGKGLDLSFILEDADQAPHWLWRGRGRGPVHFSVSARKWHTWEQKLWLHSPSQIWFSQITIHCCSCWVRFSSAVSPKKRMRLLLILLVQPNGRKVRRILFQGPIFRN